jgi:hypothetical protein
MAFSRATADNIVTIIFPILPFSSYPPLIQRIATPRLSNSLMRLIMPAVSLPYLSSLVTSITSPILNAREVLDLMLLNRLEKMRKSQSLPHF